MRANYLKKFMQKSVFIVFLLGSLQARKTSRSFSYNRMAKNQLNEDEPRTLWLWLLENHLAERENLSHVPEAPVCYVFPSPEGETRHHLATPSVNGALNPRKGVAVLTLANASTGACSNPLRDLFSSWVNPAPPRERHLHDFGRRAPPGCIAWASNWEGDYTRQITFDIHSRHVCVCSGGEQCS